MMGKMAKVIVNALIRSLRIRVILTLIKRLIFHRKGFVIAKVLTLSVIR